MFKRFPGNELPGYDHLVPTGQVRTHLDPTGIALSAFFAVRPKSV